MTVTVTRVEEISRTRLRAKKFDWQVFVDRLERKGHAAMLDVPTNHTWLVDYVDLDHAGIYRRDSD